MEPSRDLSRLLEIMAALRNPDGGCPWDIEQDFASISNYTIEEAYEVADAIERKDLSAETANADEAAIIEAIDHYFVGIEVCGTRFADRKLAGVQAGLADNMSAFGYAIDPSDWEHGQNLDGLNIELTFNGETIWNKPPKHGFGTVLASLVAYAALLEQPYPLKAGTIVTTGSLCGLVPTNGPGKGVAKMGGHTVEVELT